MSITGLGYTFTSDSLKARCLRGALRVLLPFLLKRSRQYIAFQNPDDLAFFRDHFGLAEAQLQLINGSGVDTNVYQVMPEDEGEAVVVLASRMLQDKGICEFVEAATELKSQGVQAHFILVGDVDPENPATLPLAQLQGWHDSGVIEWWGYCRDMLGVFSRTHIVCLPSYREGIPKVLIEAASCGRPIITTDVPGCREVVRHGENGYLVPVKSSQALADALSRLISNKVLRQAMGRKGRALVEQEFSLEKVIETTFKMYRSLMALEEK
jgi:glycosyltransferase involved in cell wall biosynthesis